MSTPMTPAENVAYLEGIFAKAMYGAAAGANAMAEYLARRIAEDTLRRRKHAPGQYYKAKPGEPPAYGSGTLADSMYWEPSPVSRGVRASALVGSSDKRAALFELGGCVLQPTKEPLMTWRDSGRPDNPGGWWSHKKLPLSGEVAEHPFIGPTVEEAIDDGELTRVAIDAFREYDP